MTESRGVRGLYLKEGFGVGTKTINCAQCKFAVSYTGHSRLKARWGRLGCSNLRMLAIADGAELPVASMYRCNNFSRREAES